MDYKLKPLLCLLLVIILVWGFSFPVSYGSDGFTLPVPEFTLNLQYKSIELTINNEPFVPYVSQDILPDGACLEKGITFDYCVFVKIYFDEELASSYQRIIPSSSEFTVLWLPADYPDGARIEVNVQAEYRYYFNELAGRPCLPLYAGVRVSSGENNTQTLTIHKNTQNLLNNSTASLSKPSIPEFTAELLHNLTLVVRIKNEPFTVNYEGAGKGTVGYYYKLGLPDKIYSSTIYSDYFNRSTDEYTIKTIDLYERKISGLVVDGKVEVKVKAYAGELYSVAHHKGIE